MIILKIYIANNIVPIFADSEDIPWKIVIINIDSVPGQTNI